MPTALERPSAGRPGDEIDDIAPSLLARRPADAPALGPQAEQRLPGALSYELAPHLSRPSKDADNNCQIAVYVL